MKNKSQYRSSKRKCPRCFTILKTEWDYCPFCGASYNLKRLFERKREELRREVLQKKKELVEAQERVTEIDFEIKFLKEEGRI